ncbi:MAG TPA: ATP phosphoribosyltransferase regulatory subunit, partial [Polyangiaceae bacterium]
MQGKALPGFRDFYPEDLSLRNHIFATWRNVARRYGFEEYDGPPLEALDLYTKKSGEEIEQQLYSFRDKGDRDVALRPEMTPTLARMVAARGQALKKPIRWFSIPQLFRYERQQRGRLKEHFQLNMDIIGETSALADAELIAAAIDIMRAFGFGPNDFKARLSDRRVIRTLLLGYGVPEQKLPHAFAILDKSGREKVEWESFVVEGGKIPWDALHGMDRASDVLASLPGGPDSLEPLRETVKTLSAMGLG